MVVMLSMVFWHNRHRQHEVTGTLRLKPPTEVNSDVDNNSLPKVMLWQAAP
jgi:hypothetical protein